MSPASGDIFFTALFVVPHAITSVNNFIHYLINKFPSGSDKRYKSITLHVTKLSSRKTSAAFHFN